MSLSIVYRRNTLSTCKAPLVVHSVCSDTTTPDELVIHEGRFEPVFTVS